MIVGIVSFVIRLWYSPNPIILMDETSLDGTWYSTGQHMMLLITLVDLESWNRDDLIQWLLNNVLNFGQISIQSSKTGLFVNFETILKMHSSYIDVEIWEADNRFGEIIGRFPLQKFRIDADSVRNGKWNINRWTINAPYRFKGTSQNYLKPMTWSEIMGQK